MSSARNRIEEAFSWWAGQVVRWRWRIIWASLLVAVCLASRIPLLAIETSTEDYLLDTDPAKIALHQTHAACLAAVPSLLHKAKSAPTLKYRKPPEASSSPAVVAVRLTLTVPSGVPSLRQRPLLVEK